MKFNFVQIIFIMEEEIELKDYIKNRNNINFFCEFSNRNSL